jgi:hypothetical protein
MTKTLAPATAVVGATFAWLAILVWVQPFARVNAGLDRVFGALPAWTKVTRMRVDPTTQEVSRGERPLESFRVLEQTWAAAPGATRVMLMGNSQSLMSSLAPGEAPPSGPEAVYGDLIADAYRSAGSRRVFYRLSAGALSYQEMLWYAAYLDTRPAVRPNVLLVQLNYQNFVNGGIRHGMLELLSDERFRQAVEAIAQSGRLDADAFLEALRQWRQKPAEANRDESAAERIETGVRGQVERLTGPHLLFSLKADFEAMLLRLRAYVLQMHPSGKRSLGGVRIAASRAALEDLLELERRAGVRVFLFQAPTNPAIPLYAKAEDDRSYHDFTSSLAPRYGATLVDFETRIPAQYWGMELNAGDPLHLGREGHRRMAGLLMSALEQNGI